MVIDKKYTLEHNKAHYMYRHHVEIETCLRNC